MELVFPLEYVLRNGTKVVVQQTAEGVFDFHLTRLNSMKHNFTWTAKQGISNAQAATGIGSEAFTGEEEEAVTMLREQAGV